MKKHNNPNRLYRYFDLQSPEKEQFIAANSYTDAKQQLLQQNIIPYKLKANIALHQRCWKPLYLHLMTQQLAMTLKTGLPLLKSLQLLACDHPHPAWRYLLNDLATHLSTGKALHQRLAHHRTIFSDFYCALVTTGEMTGQLETCLQHLAIQIEQKIILQKKIKKALRYPLFILLMTLFMTMGVLLFILPQFEQMYQNVNAALPALTQSLITFSQTLQKHGILILCMIISVTFLYLHLLRTHPCWQAYQQSILLHLPLIGKLIQLQQLQYCFCILAITQQAGIPLLAGLKTAENALRFTAYKKMIFQIANQLTQGESLSQSVLHHSLFPPLCYQLIHVGEESGSLETVFHSLATHYLQQTNEYLEKVSKNIEPLLMSILGLIVGGLVIAMYLPIFQLGTVIG